MIIITANENPLFSAHFPQNDLLLSGEMALYNKIWGLFLTQIPINKSKIIPTPLPQKRPHLVHEKITTIK